MPTGYTSDLANGKITTLREFALQCARGMGACIMMRDEPFDAPIPERFEPDTKYQDNVLAKLRAELETLTSLSSAECEARITANVAAAEKYRDEYLADKKIQAGRYEAMIAEVEAWTTDAEGLREFMLSQLRESLRFDYGGSYVPAVPEAVLVEDWRLAERTRLTKEIGRYETSRAEEIARAAERTRWLAALRASLPEKAES